MAEIKIEKKKPVWPWVVLVLIILGAIAYWYYNKQDNVDYKDDNTTDQMETNSSTYNDSASRENTKTYDDGSTAMMALMSAMKDSSKFGTDSTFTKTSLKNLAKITVAKARSYKLDTSIALSQLEEFADDTNNAMESNMANDKMKMEKKFKSVSDNIVSVIQDIQTKNSSMMEKEVSALKQTASKIQQTVELSKQQTTLQSFFRQAHDILHNMNS